jgi:hypothetical protein
MAPHNALLEEQLEVLRRIAERGKKLAETPVGGPGYQREIATAIEQSKKGMQVGFSIVHLKLPIVYWLLNSNAKFLDLFIHLLDEIERTKKYA